MRQVRPGSPAPFQDAFLLDWLSWVDVNGTARHIDDLRCLSADIENQHRQPLDPELLRDDFSEVDLVPGRDGIQKHGSRLTRRG